LALLLIVVGQRSLQQGGQVLLNAVGGGQEGRQLRQFQEATKGPNASGAMLLKDQVQGQQQTLEEGEARGRIEESNDCGGGLGAPLTLPPVTEGRVGDARRVGSGAAGRGASGRVQGVMKDADGFATPLAKRRFRGSRRWRMLVGRHGSCLRFGGAKARVGERAMFVQGQESGQPEAI
jgi:hypothetical protein